ncbi:hypothetical protein K440DRAFT_642013 [Wilcoxina mikolae CBS 423.85]|nr:hypothetical protein K440DRAFT_642013 [Wilcoxina mikolae CBS 423.85]
MSGKIKRNGERFSLYGSENIEAKLWRPSCNGEDENNESDADSGKGKGKEVEKKKQPEKIGKGIKSNRLISSNKPPQSVGKATDGNGSGPSGTISAPVAPIASVAPIAPIAPVNREVEDSDSDTIYETSEEDLEG